MIKLSCPNCGKENDVAGWHHEPDAPATPRQRNDPTCHYRDVRCVGCGRWWDPDARGKESVT